MMSPHHLPQDMLTQEETWVGVETGSTLIRAIPKVHTHWLQQWGVNHQVNKRGDPQSALHRHYHHRTPLTYRIPPVPQPPSLVHSNNGNHHHGVHIRCHIGNPKGDIQIPHVYKRNKFCNDILWAYKIHAQDLQSVRKNTKKKNKDSTNTSIHVCQEILNIRNKYHVILNFH